MTSKHEIVRFFAWLANQMKPQCFLLVIFSLKKTFCNVIKQLFSFYGSGNMTPVIFSHTLSRNQIFSKFTPLLLVPGAHEDHLIWFTDQMCISVYNGSRGILSIERGTPFSKCECDLWIQENVCKIEPRPAKTCHDVSSSDDVKRLSRRHWLLHIPRREWNTTNITKYKLFNNET
jgi:hypothetical protein